MTLHVFETYLPDAVALDAEHSCGRKFEAAAARAVAPPGLSGWVAGGGWRRVVNVCAR